MKRLIQRWWLLFVVSAVLMIAVGVLYTSAQKAPEPIRLIAASSGMP